MKKIPLITSDFDIAKYQPCSKGYENFRDHLPQGFHNTARPIGLITLLNVCPVTDVFWALQTVSEEQMAELMKVFPSLLGEIFEVFHENYTNLGHDSRRGDIYQAAKAFRENKENLLLTVEFNKVEAPYYLFRANDILFRADSNHRKLNTFSVIILELLNQAYTLDVKCSYDELAEQFATVLKQYVSRPTTGHRMKKPKKERWQC